MNEEKGESRNYKSVRNSGDMFIKINIFLPFRHFYGKELYFNFFLSKQLEEA